MRTNLIKFITLCAASLVVGAQGQTTPGATSPSDTDSSSRRPSLGRMGHQEFRASKLMGAEVKSSTGESLGKFEDAFVNPASGRLDFAVLSLSSSSSPGTSTTPDASATTSSTTGNSDKLVPVPWSFLRSSGMSGFGTSSTTSATASSSTEQPSFVFIGDKSKLQSAPSFERNNWPDISQSDWRQRIYAHYGMQPGSATGGATTPGGTGTSTESSTNSPSTTPKNTDQP